MSKTLLTDEDVILHLQSGDPRQEAKAIRYMQRQYRGVVISLVRETGGDPAQDVADVLNDATTAIVQNVRNGAFHHDKAKLSSYFWGIARNILLNLLRNRQTGREIYMAELPDEKPALSLNDVEKYMNSKDAGKKVAAAIEQLDDTCRKVLMQHYLKDKSMREIGQILGKSDDAVKKINQRCKERLRGLLGNDLKELFND